MRCFRFSFAFAAFRLPPVFSCGPKGRKEGMRKGTQVAQKLAGCALFRIAQREFHQTDFRFFRKREKQWAHVVYPEGFPGKETINVRNVRNARVSEKTSFRKVRNVRNARMSGKRNFRKVRNVRNVEMLEMPKCISNISTFLTFLTFRKFRFPDIRAFLTFLH